MWSFAFAILAAPTALPMQFRNCRLPPSKPLILHLLAVAVPSTFHCSFLPLPAVATATMAAQSCLAVLLQAFSYGSETAAWPPQKLRTPPCSVQWPCQPSVVVPAALSRCSFARTFFLRFRDRLVPSKAYTCSVQWPFHPSVVFPAALAGSVPALCSKLFHTVPRLPLRSLKSLGPLPAASNGLSSHPWSVVFLAALSGCRALARSFFLRFRDCRLAPSKA